MMPLCWPICITDDIRSQGHEAKSFLWRAIEAYLNCQALSEHHFSRLTACTRHSVHTATASVWACQLQRVKAMSSAVPHRPQRQRAQQQAPPSALAPMLLLAPGPQQPPAVALGGAPEEGPEEDADVEAAVNGLDSLIHKVGACIRDAPA